MSTRPFADIWAPPELEPMEAFAYKARVTIFAISLQSNLNSASNFLVGTVKVMPMFLYDVGTALYDGRIQIEFQSQSQGSAQYEPDKDVIYFTSPIALMKDTLWVSSVIVHEGVHAANDMYYKSFKGSVQINDEIAAYVAQALYVRKSAGYGAQNGSDGKRIKPSLTDPYIKEWSYGSEEQKLMRCAFELADKVLYDKCYNLASECWTEYYELYKQIQVTPPYQGDSAITSRIVKYKGLKKKAKDTNKDWLKGVPKAKVGPPKLPKK